jgi:ADP-ribosylglycohydrolase
MYLTGDSDSVGSVAGEILGTKLGIKEVPASWTAALKEKEKLEEMVRPLLEKYFQILDNKMRY